MNLTPRSFSNYSIRTKLTILTTAAMMLALVILSVFALSALIYSQWLEHEKDLLLKTRLLSAITLVSFGSGDKKPMNAALSALATDRSFLTVTIYYPDGTIAAAYNRDSETKTPALDSRPAGSQAVWDKLYFKHEIMQEGQSAGYIVIQDDLREFFRFIWIFIEGVFLAFIFSSAAGYFFLSRTRTWITSPVSRLADIMTRVSVTGDYSVRYKSEGKDEISAMISSFNEMLDQIGIRDSKLEEYSRNLEEKVFVGTRELQEKNLALKSELARRIQIENDLNREKELFIHGPVVAFKCKSEEGWPLEYISPNAGQYGYNQAELMKGDRKFEELVYASEKTKFNDDITNWLKEKTASFQGEYRLLNDNGEIFWFDITMVAVRPETGKTTHLDGYLLNITERKRNEEKLKATMEDLKRFNKLMSGREEMVLELKASLNEFMERTGLQPKYKTTADTVLPRLAFDAKKPQPDPEPSPAGADAAKRAGLEKTEVRLAIVGTTCPEPLIEAKDKGLFAQRGLNVSVRTVASWSGARELLAARKVDGIYVQVTYALLISAGYGGAPVKLKLHPVSHANDYVLALKSQLEKTGGPSNIKGKVIGVPGQYSTGQYLLYQCLADSGINPLADVRIVSVDMEKAPFYLRHGLVDGMFCRKGVLDDMEFRGEVNYFKHSRDIWRGHPCCGIALD
ncbi:MAG: ABC transporter substrate-binding protein, partial [Nitrospinota bacterium]|nr:ABC transporter substrate-binding protein [Nitrospinota bacterium]